MVQRRFGRSLVALVLIMASLAVALAGSGAGLGSRSAAAQGFGCPTAPTPAATPTGATMPAASPAASPAPVPFPPGDLTVFAAASLTDAFERMQADLETANPGLAITNNFAGSQALVTQLTAGAEADVFASASQTQMGAAVEAGLIAAEPVPFVQNRLAIVVPSDNPAGLTSPGDLDQDGVRLVLAQPEVPVGTYSRQAICQMGRDTGTYGEGFMEAVSANVVSEESDVRAVLTKVALGEADAGIVYVSDVTADVAGDVGIIEIPNAVNVVATYPIASVTGGDSALATAFIAYVLGPEGQATLADFGFDPVR